MFIKLPHVQVHHVSTVVLVQMMDHHHFLAIARLDILVSVVKSKVINIMLKNVKKHCRISYHNCMNFALFNLFQFFTTFDLQILFTFMHFNFSALFCQSKQISLFHCCCFLATSSFQFTTPVYFYVFHYLFFSHRIRAIMNVLLISLVGPRSLFPFGKFLKKSCIS